MHLINEHNAPTHAQNQEQGLDLGELQTQRCCSKIIHRGLKALGELV